MSPDARDEKDLIVSRLTDMVEAIDAINRFVEGMDQSKFIEDEKTIFAVRAAFITLGEAAGSIPQTFRDEHPGVPWREVRHFRNFMIHVYDRIDPNPLWETLKKDLPELYSAIHAILDSL